MSTGSRKGIFRTENVFTLRKELACTADIYVALWCSNCEYNSMDEVLIETETASLGLYFYNCIPLKLQSAVCPICASGETGSWRDCKLDYVNA